MLLSCFYLANFHPEREIDNMSKRAILLLWHNGMYLEMFFQWHYIGCGHCGAKLLPEQTKQQHALLTRYANYRIIVMTLLVSIGCINFVGLRIPQGD